MSSLSVNQSKENDRVSISKSDDNGNHKDITVEKIDNGYLVTTYVSGYKGEGDKKEYFSNTNKQFSKTNPLSKKKEEEEEDESNETLESLGGLFNSLGGDILV